MSPAARGKRHEKIGADWKAGWANDRQHAAGSCRREIDLMQINDSFLSVTRQNRQQGNNIEYTNTLDEGGRHEMRG